MHLHEALDENFSGAHNPLDMLERSLTLAAFCIRRMIEKRLVTDDLAATRIEIRTFPANADFRAPFHGRSGSEAYANYRLTEPSSVSMLLKDIASEIIHSSQLMIVGGDGVPQDGLLIASDWRLQKRILHFSITEFSDFVKLVLADRIGIMSEQWDPETNTVASTREKLPNANIFKPTDIDKA